MWGRTFMDSFRMHAQGGQGSEEEAQEGGTATRASRHHHHHHAGPGIRVSLHRRQQGQQGPPRNPALEA